MKKLSVQERRIRSKEKRNRRKERLDAQGLSHKKYRKPFSFKTFCIIKAIVVASIPLFYFLYSPLLIISLGVVVLLFGLTFRVEKTINRSVIRSNQVHLPKYDSALALVLILIAIVGVSLGFTSTTKKSSFFKKSQNQFVTTVENLGSVLTGTRELIGSKRRFGFGTKKPPEGFIADKDELFNKFQSEGGSIPSDFSDFMGKTPPGDIDFSNFDFSNFGAGMGARFDFDANELDLDDLPIEYMFSSILSSINTILVFSTAVLGALSLILSIVKMKKYQCFMKETIENQKPTVLSQDEIQQILFFHDETIATPENGIDYYRN